ncbi:MAG: LysM peptidoglycan-binding domain-containing protein [Thermodesulfobacteriota bacterium]
MAGRKTRVSSLVIILAGCFFLTFLAVAEENQPTAGQNEPIVEEGLQQDEYNPGFYYTVKKGDTLWDLSRKFYDSEWQWPAMWGQNKDITNPHRIYPGQRIRLYQRTDAIRQPAVQEAPMAAAEQPAAEPQAAPAESPALTVYYMFPGISYLGFVLKLDRPESLTDNPVKDPLAIGRIMKAEGEAKEMISQDDTVYIDPVSPPGADNAFIIGNLYCIYAPLTLVKDPRTGDYAGHQYQIIGAAEVTAVTEQYVKAKIIKSFDTIFAGCFVMPMEKRDKEIAIIPAPEGLTGELLLDEDHTEMSSEYSIVFLNKGEKDGVKPGQRFAIYHQDRGEIDGKEVMLDQFVFGEAIVLLTKETTATAIITKSIKPISSGDLFKSTL